MSPRKSNRSAFTLLEVVIAMAILAIVCSIVYGSFFSVTESTAEARSATETTKLKQFVMRNFRQNLDQVAQGWLPGAADRLESGEDEDVTAITFGFVGEDERGAAGPADSLEFVTLASMPGAVVLPGTVKRVRYEVVDSTAGEDSRVIGPYDPQNPPAAFLEVSESPVSAMTAKAKREGKNTIRSHDRNDAASVSWLLPIRSMDIRYFDGEDWDDDWDGDQEGRLPWAVDIRINLPTTNGREDEDQFRFDGDREEGPGSSADLQFLAALPAGTGVTEPPPTYDPDHAAPGRRGSEDDSDKKKKKKKKTS